MRTLDATGKSVDEAIFNGLRELAISIDEVEIEIIQQETKGILGIGAKPAIVRLKEREPEEIIIPDYVLNKDKPREPRERRERRDRNERNERNERRERRPRREEAAEEKAVQAETEEAVKEAEAAAAEETAETECAQEAPCQREPRQRRERRDRRERRPRKEDEPVLPREVIDYTAEAAEGNAAADFLKGLLKKMGVEAEVLANVSEEGIRLRIDSSSMGILIGHRGETLDAIQYLTSLAINRSRKETGYTRVTIDTEGYRDKREETLTRLARKIASQVKATGRARTLEPMNPYERRVLHATLQNHPYVTTYSEGEEPNRRVVIAPKGK